MKFQRNGSSTNLKMIDSRGKVVGYAFKTGNGFWHAITADSSPRLIRVPNSGYREGKGYVGPDDAGSAIIAFVTDEQGI